MTVYELDTDRVGETPAVIIRHLRGECGTPKNCPWLHAIADQIEEQTKPTRIPEPTGPLSEVMASTAQGPRRRFVRGFNNPAGVARWVDGAFGWGWDELIDPVLVREGVVA